MAGAKPEYFPVILAMAASQATARGSTISSSAAMAVVNGPIRLEIGMNCGIGAMGPTTTRTPPSAAPMACCPRICKAAPSRSSTCLGSQGNNNAYTNITFAENERAQPVAAVSGSARIRHGRECGQRFLGAAMPRPTRWACARNTTREHVKILLNAHQSHLGSGSDPVIRSPRDSSSTAVASTRKEKPIRWVHENGTLPAGVCWDYQLIQNEVLPRALNGNTWETSGAPFCAGSAPSSRRARYAHLVLSFSLRSTSSPSVASSKPGSIFGRGRARRASAWRAGSRSGSAPSGLVLDRAPDVVDADAIPRIRRGCWRPADRSAYR